jgi:hypothetical protein
MENLSKYFEDKDFISKVIESSAESDAWLQQHAADYPGDRERIMLAWKIIRQFHTNNKSLSEEDKILLFSRVLRQIEENKHSRIRKIALVMLRYAAVAIFFFSIGSLMFYKRQSIDGDLLSLRFPEIIRENTSMLIRSTGEDILLEQDNPIIEHSGDGVLTIDRREVASSSRAKNTPEKIFNQLINPYGKTAQVTLSDGTRVFLNAGSRLVYPEVFSGTTREVLLTGEAFFDVKQDSGNPFIVLTNDVRIKVTGTRFNLMAYPSDNFIEAVLASGKIILSRNDANLFEKPVELIPGQLVSYNRTTLKTTVTNVDPDYYTLWTEGIFRFESTHLSRIVKRLERYYNIRFQFSDPFLGTVQISGKLEMKEELDETIERIARAAQLHIVKQSEGVYVVKK